MCALALTAEAIGSGVRMPERERDRPAALWNRILGIHQWGYHPPLHPHPSAALIAANPNIGAVLLPRLGSAHDCTVQSSARMSVN